MDKQARRECTHSESPDLQDEGQVPSTLECA